MGTSTMGRSSIPTSVCSGWIMGHGGMMGLWDGGGV